MGTLGIHGTRQQVRAAVGPAGLRCALVGNMSVGVSCADSSSGVSDFVVVAVDVHVPRAIVSAMFNRGTGGDDLLGEMSEDERTRIGGLLRQIGGHNVSWGAQAYLDVWITEHRMRAESQATARLAAATWVLVLSTAVLAFATIALVVATVVHG